jgi:hypothetical protein
LVFNNSFLIVEVHPAHKEQSVPINQIIKLKFTTDMDVTTINPGTLLLHKVNGESIDTEVEYNRSTKTAYVKPVQLLSKSTSYRITAVGGLNGVKNVVGGTLPASKIYDFSTTADVNISVPKNLKAQVTAGHVFLDWLQPDEYDPEQTPTYEVAISKTNLDPERDPGSVIWPLASDALGTIQQTSIEVGRHLEASNYYAYVRAGLKDIKSAWVFTQFEVMPETIGIGDGNSGGGGSYQSFDILEVFPKQNQVHITPEKVLILFNQKIDFGTVHPGSVYIVPVKNKAELTLIDLMTTYAPVNTVSYTLDTNAPQNLLSLNIAAQSILQNTEYTVIVRDSVKSESGDSLGETFGWSFKSTYYPLFERILNLLFVIRVIRPSMTSWRVRVEQQWIQISVTIQPLKRLSLRHLLGTCRSMYKHNRATTSWSMLS